MKSIIKELKKMLKEHQVEAMEYNVIDKKIITEKRIVVLSESIKILEGLKGIRQSVIDIIKK